MGCILPHAGMPSIHYGLERVGFFSLEKNLWGDMTEVLNITNIAENVIGKGLGSGFCNPVKLCLQ